MFNFKKYKFGFDVWGLVVFLLIMIPNFIWFGVSAPNDVLRNTSGTPTIDLIAQIFQVILVASLCVLKNDDKEVPVGRINKKLLSLLLIFYYVGWVFYYCGFAYSFVILDLCIAPCLFFICFSISRRNCVALISAVIFMICHVVYGLVNFIL